jgi:hypothetical protein
LRSILRASEHQGNLKVNFWNETKHPNQFFDDI